MVTEAAVNVYWKKKKGKSVTPIAKKLSNPIKVVPVALMVWPLRLDLSPPKETTEVKR